MINKVILHGRLTRNPESRQAGSTTVCTFGIAVDRRFKPDEADFIQVKTFGRTAEFAQKYLSKGQEIAVSGCLRIEQWVTEQGDSRSATYVVVDEIDFCGPKREAQGDMPELPEEFGTEAEEVPAGDDLPF